MGPAFSPPKSAENRLNAEAIVSAGDTRAWCAPTSQRSPMAVPMTRADKSATEKRRARAAIAHDVAAGNEPDVDDQFRGCGEPTAVVGECEQNRQVGAADVGGELDAGLRADDYSDRPG
jgi:hypothetical protein